MLSRQVSLEMRLPSQWPLGHHHRWHLTFNYSLLLGMGTIQGIMTNIRFALYWYIHKPFLYWCHNVDIDISRHDINSGWLNHEWSGPCHLNVTLLFLAFEFFTHLQILFRKTRWINQFHIFMGMKDVLSWKNHTVDGSEIRRSPPGMYMMYKPQ